MEVGPERQSTSQQNSYVERRDMISFHAIMFINRTQCSHKTRVNEQIPEVKRAIVASYKSTFDNYYTADEVH